MKEEKKGASMTIDMPDEYCNTCGKLGVRFIHIRLYAKKKITKECEACGRKTLDNTLKHGVDWIVFK